MEFISKINKKETLAADEIISGGHIGGRVVVEGAVHNIRGMADVAFVILRQGRNIIQCTLEEGKANLTEKDITEGMTLKITGQAAAEDRAPNGFEVKIEDIEILSKPSIAQMPVPINKWKLNTSLETILNLRPLTLRNLRERSKFRIQEGIVRGFRDYLHTQDFVEIHTPKVGARSVESGATQFKLEYFGKHAVLAQSPQQYKQMMVGVFDKVFEVGPVFRAEKHNTARHINEYTSLDMEMGYIRSFYDIMEVETEMLRYVMELLKKDYAKEIATLKIDIPAVDKIPSVRFDEAKRLVSEKYDRPIKNPYDLEPEEENLIGQYFKEEYGSDFVFVTHYPSKKRPFYAMDDREDPTYTLSFDLLFRGIEITTGGQRIHDYEELHEKMESRKMTEEGMEAYMMIFKYGMPPHGGLGMGLERFTMKLLGEENVREATLFPRDLSRLEP
ncbi:MAG: aspartate--tRNA(Asn) ligase [Clostridiales bacterium]|nr:aspartate--tRNA(Asn) ligase [Clostridiales bacterium]MBS5877077.1 aspartate--tRNA(Asn) ligase [Clostridiales bacterium]